VKKTITMLALLALTVAIPAAAEEGGPDMAAMETAWAKAATPGAWHEILAGTCGKWTHRTQMWMQPGAEPLISEGTSEARMILGGRYHYETFEGVSMGQPMEGLGITGYDNTTGVMTATWYDNMGTATTVLRGKPGAPGDPLEMTGTMIDPMSGMEMKLRTVTTMNGPDEKVFEYFMSMGEMPEMKAMVITYTRVE
jgi:hypothetical protein